MRIPTAREVMTDWFVRLAPETSILKALEQLVHKHAAGAPVVDEEGALVGILTEKDCLRLLTSSAFGEIRGGSVAHFMSEVRAVIEIDMDLFAIADVFLKTNFPVLPVMERGRPVGRIGRQDMLSQIDRFLHALDAEVQRDHHDQEIRDNPRSIDRMQRLAANHSPKQLVEIFGRGPSPVR